MCQTQIIDPRAGAKCMKKLLILLLLFPSCMTLDHIPAESIYYGLDFRKYAEADFLITPEMYQGDYMTMGMVSYELYPEAHYVQAPDPKWITGIVLPKWAVDSMYNFCKSMGADALVNFRAEFVTKPYYNIANPINLSGVKISGYAIKRGNVTEPNKF
jgi:hypothetical protein